MAETYDPDDALNRSPSPQPLKIDYRVVKTPPPYIPSRSPSPQNNLPGPLCKSSRHREEPESSSLVGAALISAIDPNRPDIAQWEFEKGSGGPPRETTDPPGQEGSDIKDTPATEIAQDVLRFLQDEKPPSGSLTSPDPSRVKDEQGREDINSTTFNPKQDADNAARELEKSDGREEVEKLEMPEHSPRAEGHSQHGRTSCEIIPQIEQSATSPDPRMLAISQSQRPDALPRMQQLPPSTPNFSEPSQTLPSLQHTLGSELKKSPMNDQTSAVNGMQRSYPLAPGSSPPQKTQQHTSTKQESQQPAPRLPPQIPSSYSQATPPGSKDMSSLSPPSRPEGPHPSYWRAPPKSESSYVTSPFDPGSVGSQMGNSPSTGYPTPTDHNTPNEAERPNAISNPLQPNGPLTSSGFKCTHPGCAAAFQTQYLLNSHANVHSGVRPHFCPVVGCPRGVGGKGFKRKNEMIRHGLVHSSPGYMCPFCPEQQHRYPRPDNLQRHVRVHHVDKDRDDPLLRSVLAQRPEGGPRGRRRRVDT